MTREDNGDFSPVEADEDVDPDVVIADAELARLERLREARRRIENMREVKNDDFE